MRHIEARPRPIDADALRLRDAEERDYDELVTESAVVFENGKPTVVYVAPAEDLTPIEQAVQRIRYDRSERTAGLPSQSRTFGYLPRVTIRRDFCTVTSLANEFPHEHEEVKNGSKIVERYYREFNPELWSRHQDVLNAKGVLQEYRMAGTVFTSGIINKNNQLRYHRDQGNFPECWSNMLTFKKDIDGGYLSVPEYGLGFQLRNRTLLMFDGARLVHGVTPIRYRSPDAHRYTIVYYSLQQMWKCRTLDEELSRIRKVKSEREKRRASA